jgi:hypothetical protein
MRCSTGDAVFLQPLAVIANGLEFDLRRFRRTAVRILQGRAEHPPFPSHLVVRPRRYNIRATAQNAVKMVAHHGIAEHLDAHDPGEKVQPLANQFPALVIVFARDFVIATQKRATYAAIDAVHNLNFLIRQNIPSISPRHGKNSTR